MKKHSSFLRLPCSPAWIIHGYAAVPVICFDGKFVRGKGKPITDHYSFIGTACPAKIKLTNHKISGATVSVNGIKVFAPSNLNHNVESIEATVSLNQGNNNTIDVILKGNQTGPSGLSLSNSSKLRLLVKERRLLILIIPDKGESL